MTPRQIELVQHSYGEIAAHGARFAQVFYARMFQLDPSLQRVFGDAIALQAERLMLMLEIAVKGLSSPEQLLPMLHALGRRHRGYGVREYDFETLAQALNDSLRSRLGGRFGGELEQAWSALCALLTREMRQGIDACDTEPVVPERPPIDVLI